MRPAITIRGESAEMTVEFLMMYLLTLNQLQELRSRVESARNEQERRKSLLDFQNLRKRCQVLRSLVSVGE